ncbi:MAG: BlaI/MecI/CopY family transcriptional regulator [Verrucomicrobia bacterium]|jgi:predicted transcriptional regulator|nr:BlaI/MecI/CopY family transcriptional regulator [Verrucomicrobiota bacterium]OQC65670.1 MAG: Penicillinase repressor [Verrucomicrobia bacterium ADurb.Bin006]MDI9379393.1 BlaI/MecI/CopY family transcriptional regulator [Verrucomicrobiota bacterium]NMD22405.1 BlaI/MecI/CopY family transcriptional regulator [Verrucomicrobiota bacterium]HNU99455.1 BlaI/MecI/CopY family transcriptional regulator [Verrucomicrobiota bacterium]
MSQNTFHRLGDLQLRLMQSLWARGEASVAEVHATLPDDANLAYTTVATMLRKMEARGLVRHRVEGRTFIYSAAVAEEQVSGGMAEHVLDRLFGGSVEALVSHLLTRREVSRDELARLRKLIAERSHSS